MRSQFLTAMVVGVGLVGCAEGREPPAATAMVEITSGLTFGFGPEGMCKTASGGNPAQDQRCTDSGKLDVQYPKVTVELEPFAFDVHEVTNLQYQYCVAMGACTLPQFGNAPDPATQSDYYDNERFEDYPVVNVSWLQADEYCKFVGKRLPTEFEWERVAKGAGAPRSFPTEEAISDVDDCVGVFNATGCGGDLKMEQVGTAAKDWVEENGVRVYHLGANAAEWTATPWEQNVTCVDDPPCPTEDECQSLPEAQQPACITAAHNEPTGSPAGCAGCTTLAEGACYYMCNATPGDYDPGQTLVCVAYDSPQLASELVPVSAEQGYRGGSVTTGKGTTCVLHSWNRSQRQSKSFIGNFLGFRCASDL